MRKKYIFLILGAGVLSIAAVGVWHHAYLAHKSIAKQLAADTYQGGSDGHVGTALNLIHRHSFFGPPNNPFFGLVPRSLIYSFFVAVGFVLLGVHIWVPWAINTVFFLGALIVLYAISTRLLEGDWAVMPPLMLAFFWGAVEYVWIINTEAMTLFIITLFIYSIMRYREGQTIWWLAGAAASLAALIETKAILYYFMYIALALLAYFFLRGMYGPVRWKHYAVFAAVVISIVMGFRYLNFIHLGSFDFSRGGHQFLVHAKSAEFHGRTMVGFIIGNFVGDYVTNVLIPGFADDPQPLGIARDVKARWTADRFGGAPELETDKKFWAEGMGIARAHPVRFLLVSPFWFARLNGPVYYNLANMDHLLVGTHKRVPPLGKVAIILCVYGLWFLMMGLIFWQIIAQVKLVITGEASVDMVWILALALYINLMYSLFTTTEVRYILPVMPFYFIFLTMALRRSMVLFDHESSRRW